MSTEPQHDPAATPRDSETPPAAPAPPRFWFVFDWRLLASTALVGTIAVISCDVVNAKVSKQADVWFDRERPAPEPSEWTSGSSAEVELTLVTKDADRLACADDREFDDAHCEYKKAKRRWPHDPKGPVDDNKLDVIQPYRTAVGNYLVLVAGLWATPELAYRRHLEPSHGRPEKELSRFIALCRLRFLGRMDGAEVRWDFNQKWYEEKWAPVARAESCEIVEQP